MHSTMHIGCAFSDTLSMDFHKDQHHVSFTFVRVELQDVRFHIWPFTVKIVNVYDGNIISWFMPLFTFWIVICQYLLHKNLLWNFIDMRRSLTSLPNLKFKNTLFYGFSRVYVCNYTCKIWWGCFAVNILAKCGVLTDNSCFFETVFLLEPFLDYVLINHFSWILILLPKQ